MTEQISTDWIKPGADVLVYHEGWPEGRSITAFAKVAKVAKFSFTVDGMSERFKLETGATRRLGSEWSKYSYKVTQPDSDIAVALIVDKRRDNAIYEARVAVETWIKDRTQGNRLAAIASLQKVED